MMRKGFYKAELEKKKRLKALRLFIIERESLISEGYRVIDTSRRYYPYQGCIRCCMLQHETNNNIMILSLEEDTPERFITLQKNGKEVKKIRNG